MKKIIFIFCIGMVTSLFPLYAEIISLKTGKTVEGKIIEKGNSFVKVDIGGITLTYYFDQIEAIDGKRVTPSVAKEVPTATGIAPAEEKQIFRNWEWKYFFQYPETWEVIPTAERKDFSMGFRPKDKNRELITIELYHRNLNDDELKKTKNLDELQKTLSVPAELKKELEEPLVGAKEPGYLVRYANTSPYVLTNVAGSSKNVQGVAIRYQDYYYFSPAYLSEGKDPRFFTICVRYTKIERLSEKDNQGLGADIIQKQNESAESFNRSTEILLNEAKEIIYSFSYTLPVPPAQKNSSVSSGSSSISSKGLSLGKMKDIQDCLQRAATFIENKKFTEATEELNKALAIDPNLAEAYLIFGGLYTKQGKTDEAIASFTKALQITPQYTEAYVGLGNTYASSGKYDDALFQYNQALKLNHDSIEAQWGIAFLYNALGRYNEAIEVFKKLILRFPDRGELYRGIAEAYAHSGQYEETKRNLQKAKALFKEKGYDGEVKEIETILNEMP
jgi:tetratricopeptide (TPR) repeat protein